MTAELEDIEVEHRLRRILLKEFIFQYYCDMPMSIKGLQDSEAVLSTLDPLKQSELAKVYPKGGVVHLCWVPEFKLPKRFKVHFEYLGHLFNTTSPARKKSLFLSKKYKKFVDESFKVSSRFVMYCLECKIGRNDCCPVVFDSNNGRCTSGDRHLECKHRDKGYRSKNSDEKVVNRISIAKYPAASATNAMVVNLILGFFIENNLPFAAVGSKSFENLLVYLDPKLNIPCRKTMGVILNDLVEITVRFIGST